MPDMNLLDFFKEKKFAGCEHILIRPNIPAKSISNAVGAYSVRVEPKEIVVLIDDTAFGSAKDGILICEDRLVIREMFSSAREYRYEIFDSISCENRRLFINEQEVVKLNMPDKHELGAFFELLDEWLKQKKALGFQSVTESFTDVNTPGVRLQTTRFCDFLYEAARKVISDKVYVRPGIPAKKLQSAINAYGEGVAPEEVIVLVDDTLFGSAKDGILVTDKNLYIKIFTESLCTYEWEHVKSIKIDKRIIYVNGIASGKLVQITEKDIGNLFGMIDGFISEQVSSGTPVPSLAKTTPHSTAELELKFEFDGAVTASLESMCPKEKEASFAVVNVDKVELDVDCSVREDSQLRLISKPSTVQDSTAKDKLLAYVSAVIEQNKSKLIPLLKDKTGEVSLAALRDDSNVEKMASFIYAFLPGLVRLALKEHVFTQFMLDNRDKILAGLLPATNDLAPSRQVADHDSFYQEPLKKLSGFAQKSQVSVKVKPSFYSRSLDECDEFILGYTQAKLLASRSEVNSPEFKEYVRTYNITRFCAEVLRCSMGALENISGRLSDVSHEERSAFYLDAVILVMLAYAVSSMAYLLRTEAGYDDDETANLLAPVLDVFVFSYAKELVGQPRVKTLKDTVNPHSRVFESAALTDYKTMSNIFAKNIERRSGEDLSGHFEHFVVNASVEAFENPESRFNLSGKLYSAEGREVTLSVMAELDAQLEKMLIQHLEDRSSW